MTDVEQVIAMAGHLGLAVEPWQRRLLDRVFPHVLGPGHPLYLSSLSPAGRARSEPFPLDVRLALRLGRDHSAWARSVRWSCGRPGYVPLFDWQSEFDRSVRHEYARALLESQILRADRCDFLRISAV